MRLLLLFELFLALALAADGDPTEAPASPTTPTSTAPTPTTKTPTAKATTPSTVTTKGENNSVMTSPNTARTSATGASTVTGTSTSPKSAGTKGTGSTVSGGSTVAINSTPVLQTSTSAGTTTEPTSTIPPTTTLPKVDVEYVEFKRKCTVDGNCEYTLVAPHNDQKFLATENSLIDHDKSEVSDISSKIQQFQQNVTSSTGDAGKKMRDLTRKLQSAQALLNQYQLNLQQIQSNLDNVEYQLQFSSLYIDMLSYNPQQCYAKCLIPPSTTSPPSTPTSGPSTTPSPCTNYTCNNDADGCTTDMSNTPYCQCHGNLDGYQHCDTGACDDSGMVITTTSGNIPFYSPGFYGPQFSNFTSPSKDIFCSWTLQRSSGNGGYNATDFDFTRLDLSTSTLTFYTPNGAAIQASSKFTLSKLDSVLKESPITIEYTAQSGSSSSFFFDMIEL